MDDPWHTEADGALALEAGEFRLVVRRADHGVRYLVLRRLEGQPACTPVLLASGHEGDTSAAMAMAERTAARLAGNAHRTPQRGWRMPHTLLC